MNKVGRTVLRLLAALALVIGLAPAGYGSTPKVDPVSGCTAPAGNFSVAIGFDSTNNVPTVSADKNTNCLVGGKTVSFGLVPNSGITSWDAKFPAPVAGGSVFSSSCVFGSGTGESSSCTVASGVANADYVYVVDVWINNGSTKYTLDPRVIIRQSGIGGDHKKKRHHTTPKPADQAPPQN